MIKQIASIVFTDYISEPYVTQKTSLYPIQLV